MSYCLYSTESIVDGVRRIAHEQLHKAIDEVIDTNLGIHEKVHQVRKRCKKMRGLIRLTRPAFEDTYQRENARYRDAARSLSGIRDAQSMVSTFDDLVEHFQTQINREHFQLIRQQLVERRKRLANQKIEQEQLLESFLVEIEQGKQAVDQWSLDQKGFKAIAGGIKKTYQRARRMQETAADDPLAENLHQWRKRVKYHWYHLRLLKNCWPELINVHRESAYRLSDLLGSDHDLFVLDQEIKDSRDEFDNSRDVEMLLALIKQRRSTLLSQIGPLGKRVLCESPQAFAQRFNGYWQAWKKS